jgi:molecular chaperone GrpE
VTKKKKTDTDQGRASGLPGEEASAEKSAATVAEEDGSEAVAAAPSVAEELAASREETARNRDLYLRTLADLDNYRKRAQREKEELSRFANENVLRELLPVLDNLERAIEHARGDQGGGGILQGVEMTLGQFTKVLEKAGVKPVAALGEPFDTARHEAIGHEETTAQAPQTVVRELQKGYLLNDRLLRPAMVLLAKAPQKAQSPQENN